MLVSSHHDAHHQIDKRAVYAIGVQFWMNGVFFATFIPRLPQIRDQLGVTIEQLGEAISLAMLGGVLGSLTVGFLCRIVPIKLVMLLATFVSIWALGGIGISSALWVFAVLVAVISCMDVFADVSMNIQASQLSARAVKPVMNRLHGLWSIGTVCGSISAYVALALGCSLSQQLFVVALICIGLWVFVAMGLKQPLQDEPDKTVKTHTLWFMVGIFFIMGIAATTPELISSDWSSFRISDDLHGSNQLASLGFVAFGTGMMVGRLSGDEIIHRKGETFTWIIASVLAFGGMVLVAWVDNITLVLAGLGIAGLGISVFFPALYDMAAKWPSHRGEIMGAMTLGARFAALGIPLGVGYLATAEGVWAAFSWLALPAVVVIVMSFILISKR